MSQGIFDSIEPSNSGTELADILNDFKDAIVSGFSGTARPTELQAGGYWIDTTNNPTTWAFKLYTGAADVTVFTIDLVNNLAGASSAINTFTVSKISADAVGSVIALSKARIATNGQVLSGDKIGTVRFKGKDDDGDEVIAAEIYTEAAENFVDGTTGASMVFRAIPAGAAALVDHFRLISGTVEVLVPLKLDSLRLVSQNIATAATIAMLSATKAVVEFTGSTETSLQGIDSEGQTRFIILHNRSTADVILEHENASADAIDRLSLPLSMDARIRPGESATLVYSSSTSRWRAVSTRVESTPTSEGYYKTFSPVDEWEAPAGVTKARLTITKEMVFARFVNGDIGVFLGLGGEAYSSGNRSGGQLGDGSFSGTVSTPVSVVGGLKFIKISSSSGSASTIAIANSGKAYAWGVNSSGVLGDNTSTHKSSPVAVAGNHSFVEAKLTHGLTGNRKVLALRPDGLLYHWGRGLPLTFIDSSFVSSPTLVADMTNIVKGGINDKHIFGLNKGGQIYVLGANESGEFGNNTTTSNATAVQSPSTKLFKDFTVVSSTVLGIEASTGDMYSWGLNSHGLGGLGDTTPRSTPTLVVGGYKWKRFLPHYASGIVVDSNQVSSNDTTIFAEDENGDVYAWGRAAEGQIPLVYPSAATSSPVLVFAAAEGIKNVWINSRSPSCHALKENGELLSWGFPAYGTSPACILGIGPTAGTATPTQVLGSLKFSDFQVDEYSIKATGITTDGDLYSWGSEGGHKGTGSHPAVSSPALVVGGVSSNTQSLIESIVVDVTPAEVYNISLGARQGSFGNVLLGRDVWMLEISWEV